MGIVSKGKSFWNSWNSGVPHDFFETPFHLIHIWKYLGNDTPDLAKNDAECLENQQDYQVAQLAKKLMGWAMVGHIGRQKIAVMHWLPTDKRIFVLESTKHLIRRRKINIFFQSISQKWLLYTRNLPETIRKYIRCLRKTCMVPILLDEEQVCLSWHDLPHVGWTCPEVNAKLFSSLGIWTVKTQQFQASRSAMFLTTPPGIWN